MTQQCFQAPLRLSHQGYRAVSPASGIPRIRGRSTCCDYDEKPTWAATVERTVNWLYRDTVTSAQQYRDGQPVLGAGLLPRPPAASSLPGWLPAAGLPESLACRRVAAGPTHQRLDQVPALPRVDGACRGRQHAAGAERIRRRSRPAPLLPASRASRKQRSGPSRRSSAARRAEPVSSVPRRRGRSHLASCVGVGELLTERHAPFTGQASQNNTEHTEKDKATERTEKLK